MYIESGFLRLPATRSTLRTVLVTGVLTACAAPPDFTGYAVNTPDYYRENKAYYAVRLSTTEQYSTKLVELRHIHQLDPHLRRADLFENKNPISVVLQTVRLPSDLPTGPMDTIDVAVVLDVNTSANRGSTTLMAFYQRDVPPGQELNFKNLLVYSDPMWDEANPPYFRIRILDVRSERKRGTTKLFDQISNLSAEISGLVPHPVIPAVTTAIEAAELVLGNQRNRVLLDYQIQFYSEQQLAGAGGASLGPLVAGEWLVVGREQGGDSTFWEKTMFVDRETGRIVTPRSAMKSQDGNVDPAGHDELLVPYVSVVLMKADAEVPKLVLDRSEALLALLSSPSGKSDVDSLDQLTDNLLSAVSAFSVERRLRKYRSVIDLKGIVDQLKAHAGTGPKLNVHELRRLVYVLDAVTDENFNTPEEWVSWWNALDQAQYEFVEDESRQLGVVFRRRTQAPRQIQ